MSVRVYNFELKEHVLDCRMLLSSSLRKVEISALEAVIRKVYRSLIANKLAVLENCT